MSDSPPPQPTRALSPLAEEVDAAVLAAASADASVSAAGATSAIQAANALSTAAHDSLASLVGAARRSGVSWQVIGDALGVSRQAAFKRFGSAGEPPTEGSTMADQSIDLSARTREVFERLSAGDYEAVRATMTYSCARTLTKRKVMSVWDQVVRDTGKLESCDELTVRIPDGTNALTKFAGRLLSNGAIVQTTLRHEAGDWIGRVAYNGSGKITGLLIAPVGAEDLAF
ncbi:DUF3887 domain-containing protein [Leucobacter chromiireducens]|uniref:DUF3887 domain-containing protein n=1 Tax=Leucobacter chromiireducens TaxID=283877 RepID=UPI003F7CDB81